MQNSLQKIEALESELKALQPLKVEHQRAFDEKIRLESNYNSTNIEGNTLKYDETKALADDVKEKISIWIKNEKIKREPLIHRSDEIVYKLYFENGIKKLFDLFIENNKIFSTLFNSERLTSNLNQEKYLTIVRLENSLTEFYKNVEKFSGLEGGKHFTLLKPSTDNCKSFGIEIYFYDYMQSENHFRVHTWLHVELDDSKYRILFRNEILSEKTYRESLSDEEITKFINECIETIFEEIKIQAANK